MPQYGLSLWEDREAYEIVSRLGTRRKVVSFSLGFQCPQYGLSLWEDSEAYEIVSRLGTRRKVVH